MSFDPKSMPILSEKHRPSLGVVPVREHHVVGEDFQTTPEAKLFYILWSRHVSVEHIGGTSVHAVESWKVRHQVFG